MIAHVEHEADYLRRLRQQGTTLDDVVVVELCRGRVLIELERALNVSEVVVLVLEEAGDHVSQVLFVLL